jgi:hypothetical protein
MDKVIKVSNLAIFAMLVCEFCNNMELKNYKTNYILHFLQIIPFFTALFAIFRILSFVFAALRLFFAKIAASLSGLTE